MKVKGKLIPIRDNVLVTDMNFDARVTAGGIVLPSDDGKSEGVRHRWARVWAIGPEQKDVKVGDQLVACDEDTYGETKSGRKHSRKFRTATVEYTKEYYELKKKQQLMNIKKNIKKNMLMN